MLFWPEISALGVFFNFDNERMRPPKYPSAPPGHYLFTIKCSSFIHAILVAATWASVDSLWSKRVLSHAQNKNMIE